MAQHQPEETTFEAYVVVSLSDFLREREGGELLPVLTLVDPRDRRPVREFDLEVRERPQSQY